MTPGKKDIETESICISVFESAVAENPLNIHPEEILRSFNDTGVVLLRGFNFNLENFEIFTRLFCDKFYVISSRHARNQLQGDSYSNEVVRDNLAIMGHTEGTFRPYPPSPGVCFFMCSVPPDEAGGETLLIDGIKFLQHLPKTIRNRFKKVGITYEMYWEQERWQQEFSINDMCAIDTLLTHIPGVKFNFQNCALHLFYNTAAITKDRNGNDVFAVAILAHLPRINHTNYIDKAVHTKPSNRVYFGDGEELSDGVINELIDIHDTLVYPHRWMAHDVLLIDNTRYMHGRTMTQHPCERIITSRFGWLQPSI